MEFSHDELAGVVDLFGALTRPELSQACDELAFKRGVEFESAETIDDAIAAYRLVAIESADADLVEASSETVADEPLLAAGPTAFPTLPDRAEDLPHILDIEPREIDRTVLGAVAEERFRADAARAVATGDHARITQLLDVSYDLEAWAPVALDGVRDRLDDAAAGMDAADDRVGNAVAEIDERTN
ncbi:DUF7109 family protein [Halococcus saccharolyticus]|uniref:Uncharacterized protein n=1 Tax=Halococcus saccharolyticus DSM 5350 TaxID=1227455 RepID=M0MGP7_9EURY|nr:hypothetical protein [Halococcus saccharolyticus]EMA44891.1 hypothetical protein C449_09549 [Halococcus saccharolyticus DSM 5350]